MWSFRTAILFFVAVLTAPVFAASNETTMTVGSCDLHGITGKQLPLLVRDAIKASKLPINEKEVFLVQSGLCQDLTKQGADTMFEYGDHLPIYMVRRPEVETVIEAYAQRPQAMLYMAYIVGAGIVHEWVHVVKGSHSEIDPVKAEVEFLERSRASVVGSSSPEALAQYDSYIVKTKSILTDLTLRASSSR